MGAFPQIGPLVKRRLRALAALGYHWTGTYKLLHRGKVLILCYHRVVPDRDPGIDFLQPGMYVTTSAFESHLEALTKRYEVVSLADLVNYRLKDDRRCYCVITFDDGWRDNYLHAFPILKRYGLPATIFIATDYVGTRRWFWSDQISWLLYHRERPFRSAVEDLVGRSGYGRVPERVLDLMDREEGSSMQMRVDALVEGLKAFNEDEIYRFLEALRGLGLVHPEEPLFLDWDEVMEMSGKGISFGSHTRTHRILTRLHEEDLRDELEGALEALKARGVHYVPVLAYPNGDADMRVEEMARASGYIGAVSASFGFESIAPENPFSLRRIGIHQDVAASTALFNFRLSGLREGLSV